MPFDKIMAAVDPADVTQLAFIEAMRAIADGQKRIADEAKEQGKLLMEVRERVIRIEENRLDGQVAENKANIAKLDERMTQEVKSVLLRVDSLEQIRDQHTGATNLATFFFRYWPAIIGYFGLMLVVLKAAGKI